MHAASHWNHTQVVADTLIRCTNTATAIAVVRAAVLVRLTNV